MNDLIKENWDVLSKCEIFKNITTTEMRPLFNCLNFYIKEYSKNDFIFNDNITINNIGIVLKGQVQMLKEDCFGNKSILTVITEKELFGETFASLVNSSSTVSFIASKNCKILFLEYKKVLRTCEKNCNFHHQLIENMVLVIAKKNIQLMNKIEITSKKSLREKILSYLSIEADKAKSIYFEIPMGRVELAEYLCANRSSLTRELNKMKEDEIIDFDKNIFKLK
jgi:CRP-like cAMP-binding protein